MTASILFHDYVTQSIAQSMVFIGKFERGGALNITRQLYNMNEPHYRGDIYGCCLPA